MLTGKPGSSFYAIFMPLVEPINNALQEAYDAADESYHPESGSNQTTFGTTLYAAVNHYVGEVLKEAGATIFNGQRMIFLIGGYLVQFRNVSSTPGADITHSFPSKDRAARFCDRQIPLWAEDQSIENERYVVLGHMGNATEGFTDAHLCIRKSTGEKPAWAFTEPIFKGKSLTPSTTRLRSVPAPKAQEIPKAKVVRKKKKKKPDNDPNK